MSEKIRSFIAVPLPPPMVRDLKAAQAVCRKHKKLVAGYPNPRGLHITLHFLGDCNRKTLLGVKEKMALVMKEVTPFELCLERPGIFPGNLRAPKILWMGIGMDVAVLTDIHQRLGNCLKDLGLTPEKRPFSPHVTLARFKRPPGEKVIRSILDEARPTPTPFRVREIQLFKSRLTPEGAVYTPLFTARARG